MITVVILCSIVIPALLVGLCAFADFWNSYLFEYLTKENN